MKKEEFTEVLLRYTNTTTEEAQKIIELKNEFPFSQLLHVLAARASKDHSFTNSQEELQLAAIYSANRTVLKEIITKPVPVYVEQPVTVIREVQSVTVVEEQTFTETSAVIDSTHPEDGTIDVADELMIDLKRLNELKQGFEALFVHEEDTSHNFTTQEISPPEATPKAKKPKGKSSKTRAQRIVELAKKLQEQEASAPSEESKKESTMGSETIIEEIANSKKQFTPESSKQKEQIEIIDQFIRAQPSITSAKDKTFIAPQGDLSTIKSGEFGDNVISETLVDILLKQGKKDKAIEVLKKLIWKFPQKKTYFAAQIEELKK